VASYPPPPPPGSGGQPPGYGPPGGQYGGYGPTRSTNGKAIAALICGIAAFVVCPLTAIAAVILGPQAKREIAAQPDRYDGAGMAQAGVILGWVALALSIVGTILFVLLIIVAANSDSTTSFESLAALVG
jgi:hypothetical protein